MILQVGVKALIKNSDGLYLFLQRSRQIPTGEKDAWDIPGGRLAVDEDIALDEALRREILEETGMRMAGEPELLSAQDILKPEIDLHVIRLTYSAKASGEPELSDEHQTYKWATLDEAQQLNTDRYLQKLLAKLVQNNSNP